MWAGCEQKSPKEISRKELAQIRSANASGDPGDMECPRCIPCEMDGTSCEASDELIDFVGF